jgi:hypothetical protein
MEFYDIALAKLLQTLPELGNYIVTFKDVSEELSEDNGVQVGIFILKAGTEYMFVPTVSKGDNVYPIDSIFISSKGKFFPLTRKTLNLISSLSQNIQGKATKIPDAVVKNPDLSQLINPPRTGKFVYASSSRLGDFLGSMPNSLKSFTIEKIAAEQSMYENLHSLFNLKDIFDHLKATPGGLAAVTNQAPISILDVPSTKMTDSEIQNVLDVGYVVQGAPTTSRVAVSHLDYNKSGSFTQVTNLDGNKDYELMLANGNAREAFIPKQVLNFSNKHASGSAVAIFTNGDYATGDSFISVGDIKNRKNVLTSLFDFTPPVLPKDLTRDATFALITTNSELLGVFRANDVSITNMGVEISATVLSGSYSKVRIHAYRNFANPYMLNSTDRHCYDLYIPYASLTLMLGEDVSHKMEKNVNSASRKREIGEAGGLLGHQVDIGFDGVEFFVNRQPLGKEASVMKRLVVDEGIDPVQAVHFIKQAKENRFVKVYLSKSAAEAAAPAEMPQYGAQLPSQPKPGLNGSFVPNVQNALKTGDAQSVEATIISELLQTPDMFEMIAEYLPDIEECIDRLGRILLLSRVNIEKLADGNDADNVFAFLANLKAVYRMLGDNYMKLEEMVAMKPEEAGSKVKADSK